MGRRATELTLRHALAGRRPVHVATHAALTPENPLFSWLAVAGGRLDTSEDDGRLELREVLGLTVRTPLVFLSGCETGVGRAWSNRFTRGEDYATLAQAFLYAGAGSVLATLWPVEDEGAAELAARFYREWASDVEGTSSEERGSAPSAARALARAQRSLLHDPRFGSPYHWAAYRISG